MWTLLTAIDVSLLSNIVLISLFALFIIGLLIAAIIGYKKGVFSSTFRLIFMSVLVALSFCLLTPEANLIGKFPLDKFLSYSNITLTNTISGQSYYIPITNLFDTTSEFFKGYYILFNVSGGASVTPSSYAIATATSLIKLVTLLLDFIIILIFGNLLGLILWHALFKHLIPKVIRKRIKLPWLGLIERATTYIVLAFLFFSPLSALVNITSQAYKRNKINDSSNRYVNYVGTFLDTYDKSVFANAFFNWTVDDNGMTLDAQLLSYLTSTTVNNVSADIVEEINNVVNIGTTLSNFLTDDFQFDYSPLLSASVSTEVLNALFQSIENSHLIMGILPIAATMVVNSDIIADVVDLRMIDVSDIEWNKEISNIKYIATDILNTGILDTIVDSKTNLLKETINVEDIVHSMLENESYGYYKDVFKSIDNSKLLTRAVPAVIKYLSTSNQELNDYLPSSWDALNDISWGNELSLIYDSIYRINCVEPTLLDFIFTNVKNNTTGEKKFTSELVSTYIAPNIDIYRSILVGETISNGELNDKILDKNGRTIVYENSKKTNGRNYCLFDSELIRYSLSKVSETLFSSFGDSLAEEQKKELSTTLDDLSSGNWRLNYKEEFASIFYSLEPFKDNPKALKSLVENPENIIPENDLSKIDSSLVNTLSSCLVRIDNSKLLSSVLVPTMKNILLQDDMKSQFTELGLDVSIIEKGLNTAEKNKNIGKELASVVSILPDVGKLANKLNNSSLTSDVNALLLELADESLVLVKLLETLYKSEIINPKNSDDQNFYGLLTYIFKQADFTFDKNNLGHIASWTSTLTVNDDYYLDKNGNPVFDGEIGKMINVIKAIGESEIVKEFSSLETSSNPIQKLVDYETREGNVWTLDNLLKEVNNSVVFSSIMGSYLDNALESTGLINENAKFEYVTDWAKEGENFHQIIISFDDLELNLSNLDFTNVTDIVKLNDVLHALANSTIFERPNGNGTSTYSFGSWIYDKMISSSGSEDKLSNQISAQDLFKDPNSTTTNAEGKTDWDLMNSGVTKDSSTETQIFEHDVKTLTDREDWSSSDYVFGFDTSSYKDSEGKYYNNPEFVDAYFNSSSYQDDEISYIIRILLNSLRISLFASDGFKISNLNSSIFKDLLYTMNESTILRMSIFNIYEIAKKSIKNNDNISFNLDGAYTPYLVTCLEDTLENTDDIKSKRQDEIDVLVNILDGFKSIEDTGIFKDGEIQPSSFKDSTLSSLKNLIKSMNESKVFHRLGNKNNKDERTAFQDSLYLFYSAPSIHQIIYNSSSPKDQFNELTEVYSPYEVNDLDETNKARRTKANYLVHTTFPYNPEDGNFKFQTDEIDGIFEVFSAFVGGSINGSESEKYPGLTDKNGNITTDFKSVEWNEKNCNSVKDYIFPKMNETITMRDGPSNLVYDTVTESTKGLDGFKYVSFYTINPYYQYFKGFDGRNVNTIDWNAKLSDYSLEFIAGSLNDFNQDDPNSIVNLLSDFEHINSTQVELVENFLVSLLNEEMTNTEGPRFVLSKSSTSENPIFEPANEYTLFQTVMQEVYSKMQETDSSGNYVLKGMFYNEDNPKDKNATEYSTAKEKINYVVSSYYDYNGNLSAQGNEIFKIFDAMKGILGDGTSTNHGLVDSSNNSTSDLSKIDWTNDNNITLIEGFLKNINETDTLSELAPNALGTRIGDLSISSDIKYVQLQSLNVYYQYFKNGDYSTSGFNASGKMDESEITYIVKLLKEYNAKDNSDSLFYYLNNIRSLKDNQIISLGEKLEEMNQQAIFHVAGPKEGYETTLFQQIMEELYVSIQGDDQESGVFFDRTYNPKDKITTHYSSVDSKVQYVATDFFKTRNNYEQDTQQTEIESVFNSLSLIFGDGASLNPGLVDSSGHNTLDFSKVVWNGTYGTQNIGVIGSVLEAMNKTETLYDVVPNGLRLCLKSVTFDKVNLNHANTYYQYYKDGVINFKNKLTDSDLEYINSLLKEYANKDDEDSLFYLVNNANNLNQTQANTLKGELIALNRQPIFHTAGLLTADSGIENSNQTTVFQELMVAIYTDDSLGKFFFNASSTDSKDYYYINSVEPLYTDLDSKALYISKLFFTTGLDNNYTNQEKEIGLICDFITYSGKIKFIGNDGFLTDSSTNTDANIEKINTALHILDKTETMYDIVPNAFYSFLNSNLDSQISGIDFKKATIYWHYNYASGPTNYEARYFTSEYDEIETLTFLMSDLVKIKDKSDLSNIGSISDDDLINIYQNGLLLHSYESHSLHLDNKNNVKKDNSNSNTTVFEDIIYKIYHDTKLDAFNYDDTRQIDIDYQTDGTKDSGIKNKILTNIRDMSRRDQELIIQLSKDAYNTNWFGADGEVPDLINLAIKSRSLLGEGTFGEIQLDKLTADQSKSLMQNLNDLTTISDALPTFIRRGFSNLGLVKLTTISEEKDGITISKDIANYFLTNKQFGGENNTCREGSEIDNLYNLLKAMEITDSSGNKQPASFATGNIKDNFKNSTIVEGMLTFLKNSKIYNSNPYVSLEGNINAGGTFFINALETIDMGDGKNLSDFVLHNHDYINGTKASKFKRIKLIDKIIAIYDPSVEAQGLTKLVGLTEDKLNYSTFKSSNFASFFNETTIGSLTSAMEASYNADGNNNRSYLTSELVSGLLSEIMEGEYKEAKDKSRGYYEVIYFGPKTSDDFLINSYDNISKKEKDGILGSVRIYQLLSNSARTKTSIEDAFALMGNKTDGNSYTGRTFYVSRISPLINGIYLYKPDSEFIPVSVTNKEDMYLSPTFNFETYGKEVASYLVRQGLATE